MYVANFFHALQYFAIVWFREGKSIQRSFGFANRPVGLRLRSGLFATSLLASGCTYVLLATCFQWGPAVVVTAPLLHFWYDGFVWSVRKLEVASPRHPEAFRKQHRAPPLGSCGQRVGRA